MKTCCRCKEAKALELFPKDKSKKDGHSFTCKACKKEYSKAYHQIWYEKNRETKLSKNAEWLLHNKQRHLDNSKKWRDTNQERQKASIKRWMLSNKHRCAHTSAKYRASRLQATPSWANQEEISRTYALARWVSDLYQKPFEVDHIIPLQGKTVCGLHVENNLQILPMPDNRSKSNKLIEEHP